MFRVSFQALGRAKGPHNLKEIPNMWRIVKRRKDLEERRISEARTYTPPVEPTRSQSIALYRRLMKASETTLRLTNKKLFRDKLRSEFLVTARRTSGRVRGLMFEKGEWMVANKLGGLL